MYQAIDQLIVEQVLLSNNSFRNIIEHNNQAWSQDVHVLISTLA